MSLPGEQKTITVTPVTKPREREITVEPIRRTAPAPTPEREPVREREPEKVPA